MKITKTMLAKDILKWLEPKSKVKIRPRLEYGWVAGPRGDATTDLQELLMSGRPCEVCALGALVCAVAFRKDEISLCKSPSHTHAGQDGKLSLPDRYGIVSILQEYFDPEECALIEGAFEDGTGLPSRVRSAKGRLRAICENIVSHRGKFVPLEAKPWPS
jgi:hypothetical protein